MTAPSSNVIFANDSEVGRVATNHLGLMLRHVVRRCHCRTEDGCRRRMREQIQIAMKVLAAQTKEEGK